MFFFTTQKKKVMDSVGIYILFFIFIDNIFTFLFDSTFEKKQKRCRTIELSFVVC